MRYRVHSATQRPAVRSRLPAADAKTRITAMLGEEFSHNSVYIENDAADLRLSGLAALPACSDLPGTPNTFS